MRRGIMGGTFDPVHLGHLELARHAQAQLRLDGVLWVPAGQPWRKEGREIAPGEHRLEMVRLAIKGEPAWRLSTVELDGEGPSYSVETVETLQAESPGDTFVLLLGQDALEDLPNWHDPARLIQLVELAVAPRGEARPAADELERLLPGLSARVTWVEMPVVVVSATDVRRRAAAGQPLAGLVPQAVAEYIKAHQLYR